MTDNSAYVLPYWILQGLVSGFFYAYTLTFVDRIWQRDHGSVIPGNRRGAVTSAPRVRWGCELCVTAHAETQLLRAAHHLLTGIAVAVQLKYCLTLSIKFKPE